MSPPSKKVTALEKLRVAKSRADLAAILGFKPSAMTSIIYKTPVSQKYNIFEISKKNGGVRTIKAPSDKLKKLQTRLATILYECLDEIQDSKRSKPVSFAFRKNSSTVLNAKKHKRKRYVFNIDLEDFFPAFNFGRVRGFFLKDDNFKLHTEVGTTIAQIACDGSALPQGSPCSPIISELIGQILDLRLLRFAKKYGLTYSRYADDITFSTNQKTFPFEVAVQDKSDVTKWIVGSALENKITQSGFNINTKKTRMHIRGSRQMVNGLIVNEKVNISSSYYRTARAMCDSLFQTGTYYKNDLTVGPPKPLAKTDMIEGILSYIYYVTQQEDHRSIPDQRKSPRAIRTLYRRFLFYKYCIDPKRPFIITEGKTDPIYIREAIRNRSAFHPKLGMPGSDGFKFSIQFLNYESQGHEILDLGGGTGDLKSIPLDYSRNLKSQKIINGQKKGRKPIKNLPMNNPVILLVDNDDGLGDVASTIKRTFNVAINKKSSQDFYHITQNLYLVKTPEHNGDSCIEDLFPKKWLKHKLNGKSFNYKSKINISKEYGKEVFAKSVVKKNSSQIDFSDFDVLLRRIELVLDHYSTIKP